MDYFFSIIIPTYNRENLLHRALDSVLAQTYPNWECIVVDDHSTDNTQHLLDKYVATDSRIKVIENTHRKGASGARNTGLDESKYDWIVFFDSDNRMHDDLLESVNSHLNAKCADVLVWHSNIIESSTGEMLDKFDPVVTNTFADDIWTEKCYVDTNNAVIKKEKLVETGGWDERCPSMEEWDLHLRLSECCRYCSIPDVLLDYYVRSEGSISADSKTGLACRMYILKKHRRQWCLRKEAGIMNLNEVIRLIFSVGTNKGRSLQLIRIATVVPSLFFLCFKRKLKVKLFRK